MKRRLAIVTTHPIQYQAPWFRHLAAQEWVEPHVFFGSRHGLDATVDHEFGKKFAWDIPLLEGYKHEFLKNVSRHPDVNAYGGVDTPSIVSRLREGGFGAVLVLGWHVRSFWQAFRAAEVLSMPLILRGESNLLGPRPWWKSLARRLRLAPLFRHARAFLSIGRLNREFYLSHGVPVEKICDAPYFVDNERFQKVMPKRKKVRARLGIQKSEFAFCFSGKLVARKRPQDLLEAWDALPVASKLRSQVLFIGDGAMRGDLESRASRCEHPERVRFLGFQNQSMLPELYAASDALVLPSDFGETWGLSANEAMACGARAIVSDRVGCAPDLIIPGVTGEVFSCGDRAQLRGILQRYVQDMDWIGQDARRDDVLRHVARFSMQETSNRLRKILESA